MEVHQPRLDHGELVLVVDLEDPRHAGDRDDDAALARQAPAGEAGPRPAGDERQALRVGEPDAGGDLGGGAREDDGVGGGAEDREPVRLVDQQLVGLREHAVGADDRLERRAQPRPVGP